MLVLDVHPSSADVGAIQPPARFIPRLNHSQYVPAENVAEREAAFDRVSRAGNARALVQNIDAFCDCV